MEVDGAADVKNELPTPPASDVGSPTSFSHCGSDSEPDSPMVEEIKVRSARLNCQNHKTARHQQSPFHTLVTLRNTECLFYSAAKFGHVGQARSRGERRWHVGPFPHGVVRLHLPLPLPQPSGCPALLIRQQLSRKSCSHCPPSRRKDHPGSGYYR